MSDLEVVEGDLCFQFPADWLVAKFDSWAFYRNQFSKIADASIICSNPDCRTVLICKTCGKGRVAGTKGVDIVAIDLQNHCWLIEIKDYRVHKRPKVSKLAHEVVLKVRDTLAALAVARINANNHEEKTVAAMAMSSTAFRVVLHLELPDSSANIRAAVIQKMKPLMKSVEPHPKVASMEGTGKFAWTCSPRKTANERDL